MRIASSVTAISWIPSDAIEGMPKLPFELGVARYDAPPPDTSRKATSNALRAEDRFREANHLAAWIEVEDGKIVGHGYEGDGLVGSTTFHLGIRDVTIPGVAFEVLRQEPEVRDDSVRFVQTVGGRAGFPAPRMSRRQAVRPHPLGDRLDDARAHDPRRRLVGARARRSEHVPAALDLRRRRRPRREVGDDRLQGLVPGGARRATRRGATRTRMPSSRPRRARSSGRSRAS